MKVEKGRTAGRSFVFRVRLGEYEIEVSGARDEVLKTIEGLPNLIGKVNRAFEDVRPKKVATLTVKTERERALEAARDEKSASEKYPRIPAAETCNEAVLRLLETDWGKWRPRTHEELRDALKANGLEYPTRMLAAVLADLVKQEKIRRWNTDAGYVYILAEKEAFGLRRDSNE